MIGVRLEHRAKLAEEEPSHDHFYCEIDDATAICRACCWDGRCSGLDWMRVFKERSDIKHGASFAETDLAFNGRIAVGKFLDIEKPTFEENMDRSMRAALGDAYQKIETSQAATRALRDC